jgi:hypothetical protein
MIAHPSTRLLFAELRKLIPDIPEHTIDLDIRLRLDSVPVIVCRSQVRNVDQLEEKTTVFHLKEVEKA